MSHTASNIVRERSQHRGSTYHVLLAIGDHADGDGLAFPSLSTLAIDTRSSRRQVVTAIATLTQSGELIRESGNRIRSNRYKIQIPYLLTLPQRYPKNAREVTSLHSSQAREATSPHLGKPLPQGREATSLYPSYNQEEDKNKSASLRDAGTTASLRSKEESAIHNSHNAHTQLQNDTPNSEAPEKTDLSPPPSRSRRGGRERPVLQDLPGFPPQAVVDIWNGFAKDAGMILFTEEMTPKIQQAILTRQHEKREPTWWQKKFADVTKHKWLREEFNVTLMWLVGKGWDSLSSGQYAAKPPAVRKVSL